MIDGSHSGLRSINQQRILSEIILSSPITRTELMNRTGLTNASVSRITKSLIDAGLIVESTKLAPVKGPGRRFVHINVNHAGGYVIGLKINALRQSIVVLDLGKNELVHQELNLESLPTPDVALDEIATQISQLINRLEIDKSRILGIGVAITGAVDAQTGVVVDAPAIGWKDIAVAQILSSKLDLSVHVENLPNAINLCEHQFGITRKHKNIAAINAALGIGSSLILDDHLVRGNANSAGLLGQLTFTDSGQFSNQTVDDLTAGWRVLAELNLKSALQKDHRMAAKKLIELLQSKTDDDGALKKACYKAGKSLGRFIELYIAMTNPGAILLSGPLSQCEDYLNGIQSRLAENPALNDNPIELITSQITGSTAAGWLAINEFLIQRPIDLTPYTLEDAA